MPKKKRKKNGGKGGWRLIADLSEGIFKGSLRVAPFVICFLALSALFMSVRKLLYADGGLTVYHIEVVPAQSLSIEDLAKIEQKIVGKNILKVDLNQLSRELEQKPRVRQARAMRSFPNHIRIEVEARLPIAFIRFSPRGPAGLISKDGVILNTLREPDGSACLIEASGFGAPDPVTGKKITHRGFLQAAEFIETYHDHSLAEKEVLSKLSYDGLGNVSITLGAGPLLRLGRRPSERIEALAKFMNLLEGEDRNKIDYVDLQFDNVVIKRKGA